jgi:hypothetical protein
MVMEPHLFACFASLFVCSATVPLCSWCTFSPFQHEVGKLFVVSDRMFVYTFSLCSSSLFLFLGNRDKM